ncbi:ribosome silencing factor [bacterium]|nr:ribosome silencing factor [bacterium]
MTEETKPEEVVRALAETIAEKMGQDVRILDLRGLTDIADWFIIASAKSERHLRVLGQDMVEEIKAADIGPMRTEGLDGKSWVIIDLFDIVVHIFTPERREFYSLERYWGDAPAESIDIDAQKDGEDD